MAGMIPNHDMSKEPKWVQRILQAIYWVCAICAAILIVGWPIRLALQGVQLSCLPE